MDNKSYTNERSQLIILSLLKSYGIRKIIASPGTTNITLVGSMQNDPWFEIYSSVDERSAAYMACGLAAETGEPVVLSCTGATASRNYYPGLTEAYYRKLPVLAITANQGRMKVGNLIAQNIDRSVLANDAVRMSVSIPVIKDADDEWNCELLINKALSELTRHGGGPVHIDMSTTYSRDFSVRELPQARVVKRIMCETDFPQTLQGRIAIFIGSHRAFTKEETLLIDKFCAANNAVVFCDHTSGYYGKYRVQFALVGGQYYYHSQLLDVDLLIHLGEVSGDYDTKLSPAEVWRVSEDGEFRDTFRTLSKVFEMEETRFFKYYSSDTLSDDSYLQACRGEYQMLYEKFPSIPFGNIWIAHYLSDKLPDNSVLHFGILNTLRSWNFFNIPNNVLTYSNVGGFGIDGGLSTLIGASLANSEKLYLGVIGDLAFFYDMNVLGNRAVGANVRLMLINNGRGTEFRLYSHPGNAFGDDADKYIAAAGHFGNKSPMLVKHYAEDLGFEYISASTETEFKNVFHRFISEEKYGKPLIFEVFTDSKNESEALDKVYSIIPAKVNPAKKLIKDILGEKNIRRVRNFINK